MDWDDYKELSHSPPYFTRWALDRTADVLDQYGVMMLRSGIREPPLEKPSDHKGGPETDVLKVELSIGIVEQVLNKLRQLASSTDGTIQNAPFKLDPLIKSWEELHDWLEESEPTKNSDN